MASRRNVRVLSILGCLLIAGMAGAQQTTYTYVGTHYLNPTGVFTTSMSINGSFTTANPLPPNISADIGPLGDGRAIAWSFNNGISTFTQANSAELYGSAGYFYIATDANGNVSNYQIGLVSPQPPHSVGTVMNFFFISHGSQVQALYQATCAIASANVCTFLPFAGTGTVSDDTETGAFLPTNNGIPTASWAALGLLAALLAAFGVFLIRARL